MRTDRKIKFKVECEMVERWVPQFVGMLQIMEYMGHVGKSRDVVFMSDGDGDFNPKFSFDQPLPSAKGKGKEGLYFDAG